ncbi:MAG: MFS transporter [Candidatus Midichloria sp.]|nr:MAG: MFS transporter [Candidatus Midichloria sp.]
MSSSYSTVSISFLVSKRPYITWIAAAVFYFYQYILRVSPGMMIDDIRSSFSIRAEEFATLGSIYLIFYSLLQIPLGILIDKFGVKKILSLSIIFCITGSFIASIAPNFLVMQFSRAIIGSGSAAAFLISLKIVADNFSPGRRGFLMGTTLTLGTVGALFSGQIVVILLQEFHWRYIWQFASLLGLGVLFLSLIFIPAKQEKVYKNIPNVKHSKNVLLEVIQVMKDKNVILYSVLAVGLYTPLAAVADLWGTAFISTKFGFDMGCTIQITMMLYLGLAIGSIVLPWFFERNLLLNTGIRWSAFIILIAFAIVLYGPKISIFSLTTLLIIIGVFCGSEMICFTAALRYANENNSGEIIGVVNTLNMLGGALLQQLIGYLLDMNWDGVVDQCGLRVYSMQDFVFSLSSLIILIFCCWLISFVLDKRR